MAKEKRVQCVFYRAGSFQLHEALQPACGVWGERRRIWFIVCKAAILKTLAGSKTH